MRPYDGRVRLLHCDVYRLEHLQEILDLGIIELVDEDAVAVIEWGDLAEPVLPADFLEVRLLYRDADDERGLTFRAVGASWAARVAALQRAIDQWLAP
jgi:tRNA threonylcarbamoyladenosine biosynthesis protein TsaE